MTFAAALAVLAGAPLIPDGDEGQQWAEDELAKPEYAQAEPNLLDRIAYELQRFLGDLLGGGGSGGFGPFLLLIAVAIGIGIIVAIVLIWGVPRSAGRARAVSAELFGDDDVRSAAELRAAAEAHAKRGEWDEAIVLRMRALARGTHERGIIRTPPGTTVQAFARAAAAALPAAAAPIAQSATIFDDVRYLRRPGTASGYATVADADTRTARTRPTRSETPADVSG